MIQKNKLRVAAVGDLHVHETSRGFYRPMFEEISSKADVLLICGDLTNLGLPLEASNLAEDLSACKIPVMAVLGNHDHHSGHVDEVKKILSQAKVVMLDHENFVHEGVGFAGVKGFGGGFDRYVLGPFGEDATKHFVTEAINQSLRLENSLKNLETDRIVIALHYSPVSATVVGEPPEIFPYLGSSRLAETIDRFENVKMVVHGHAHHGTLEGRTSKGVPVFNCSYDLLRKMQNGRGYYIHEV